MLLLGQRKTALKIKIKIDNKRFYAVL